MQAVILRSAGATPEVANDVAIPQPGKGEVLVKALYTAINPVDGKMAQSGAMIKSWPWTPGCDVAGEIVAVGSDAISALGHAYKVGDRVFGCTRLGSAGYAAWAEYLLFDASLCIPVPSNLDIASAAASGVGIMTAGLGIYGYFGVPVPDANNLPLKRGEWAIVFGGSGSVGQFAVQFFALAGFKVVATGSEASFELLKKIGADIVIDYKQAPERIIQHIKSATSSNLTHAFDAAGPNNPLLSSLFAECASSTSGQRKYTTVNVYETLPESMESPFQASMILLGDIGQPEAVELNNDLRKFIPSVYALFEKGLLIPNAYREEGQGIEGILKAWELQKKGSTGGVKIVAKIAGDN